MKVTFTFDFDEKDIEKLSKGEPITDDVQTFSNYARFFDESCAGWNKEAEYNLTFLKLQQQYANDILKAKGYIFLNEVYDMLGIARSKAGQVVGWIYDENNPVGDNCVDFNLMSDCNRAFVNGFTNIALLDFNVDGNILDRVL